MCTHIHTDIHSSLSVSLGDYFKICDAQVPHMNGLVELDLCICGFSRPLDMEGQLCVCVCVCVCVSLLKSK